MDNLVSTAWLESHLGEPDLRVVAVPVRLDPEVFGVVGMQTDDTLILGSEKFSVLEEDELNKAKLSAKPKEALSPETPLIFNGCVLTQQGDIVELRQKEQGKKLQPINEKGENP